MEEYEIAGLSVFRYIEPRFNLISDDNLIWLYHSYSEQEASARWLGVTRDGAKKFCEWAYKCPVDYMNSKTPEPK
jgi:hypothetical protein